MTRAQVDERRLKRFMAASVHLRSGKGAGANGHINVCVMQAVDWLAGGNGHTDAPSCTSKVLRRFCISLNDSALFSMHRDLLKPYAPRLVNTAAPAAIEYKRACIAVDYAVRIFTPIRLRALKKEQWAKEFEAIPRIHNRASAIVAREAVYRIRAAVAYVGGAVAAAVTYATAYAIDVGGGIGGGIGAVGAAVGAAAVGGAADVGAAVGAASLLRTKALECIDAMLAVTK